jgi:hypothetical protein
MSRYYSCRTSISLKGGQFTKTDYQKAEEIYDIEWSFQDGSCTPEGNLISLYGESSLCSGEREDEAHIRFTKAFRNAFPDCRVETIWTYLEDLPCETYTTEPGEKIS